MKKNRKRQPKYRLLKAGCVGAGLLSISNPTQVTAADIGILDIHNGVSLATLPNPFPRAPMGVHVAAGDLDGDGRADIIVGPGRGDNHYAAADSISFNFSKIKWDYYPQKMGVRVATGDLDGDGKAEIIVSNATGGPSTASFIKLPDIDGESKDEFASFDNIHEGFSGGVSVATGDFDGDMAPDVLAGRLSCACGRPIKIKKPPLGAASGFEDFGPPVPSGQGGVQVAAGDIDGDGLNDLLVLPVAPTSGISQPLIALSKDDHKQWIDVQSFNEPAGVHIAMGDLDNDGIPDLVVGSARKHRGNVKYSEIRFSAATGTYEAVLQGEFDVYDENFLGGVRVAVGDVNGDGYQDLVYAPAAIPEPTTLVSLFAGIGALLVGGRRRRRDEPSG
jgi:hypothetical protein